MRRDLTKKFLVEQNITVDRDHNIYHKSKKRGVVTKLKQCKSTTKHKYGKDRTYLIVAWYDYDSKKTLSFTVHQIIYAWFIEDIPAGYDVDHINNDSTDNRLVNLQLLTRKENLAKRKNKGINQYYYINNHNFYTWRIQHDKNKLKKTLKEKQNEI